MPSIKEICATCEHFLELEGETLCSVYAQYEDNAGYECEFVPTEKTATCPLWLLKIEPKE